MPDERIVDLATLAGGSVATGDELVIVDVSDSTMDASGTAKKITADDLAIAVGALLDLAGSYQPLDSDLTAIAALSTTSFGRALLELADAAAGRSALALGTAATSNTGDFDAAGAAAAAQAASQPLDSDLTAIAALSTTNDDVLQRKAGAWTNRTIAQLLTDLAAAGTTFQPLDSDLTAIAALSTTSFGRGLLALADAAAGRTALGLGTAATSNTGDFDAAGAAAAAQAASQPLDSDLTAIAALSTTSFGRGLLALADAAALRTSAGVVIGTDVEAHDTDLTTIAGLSPTNDDVLQRKAGAWTNRTIAQLLTDLAAAGTTFQPLDSDLTSIAALSTTSFGRGLLALADAAALRTTAGLVIGTDVEAHDADLTTIAGLSPTNDDVLQRKSGAWTNRTLAQLIADLAALGTTFQPLDSDLTSIAALATTSFGRSYLTQSATGRPKISGGAALPALPGCVTSSSIGTVALAINTVLYSWIFAYEDITLTAYTFEVTAAPASNAHVRTGIYAVDTDWQPSGAPLLDNEIAVASGFTGQKTSGAISVALTKGKLYAVAVNVDVAMTLRIENAGVVVGPGAMLAALGASGNCVAVSASQTYGAFPNPGTAWTTTTGGAAPGIRHYIFWTW